MVSRAHPKLYGWKKDLADDYEKSHGVVLHLDLDPILTFDMHLVITSSTPVASQAIAGSHMYYR